VSQNTETAGRIGRPMIVVEGLTRTFGSGDTAVHAVNDVSFSVPTGQLCAIVGRSGSGKTTLLNLIGGLDKPDAGRIEVDGKQLAGPGKSLGERDLAALRRDLFGFVFQSFALIPILSASENVGIPLRLRKTAVAEREERVALLLNMVGLGDHVKQRPGEMSGGQQQRVALARALANSPRVLIADEPTGQLDSETGRQMMRLLRAVVAAENVTALVATHDPLMMELADRVITVGDGHLVSDSANDPEGVAAGVPA
jgi:putative ABC transport system ATP-binding protein